MKSMVGHEEDRPVGPHANALPGCSELKGTLAQPVYSCITLRIQIHDIETVQFVGGKAPVTDG